MTDEDRFMKMTDYDRREYVAQALGCNPKAPDGWPNGLVDRLVALRLQKGSREFYIALGTILSAA